MNVNELFLSHFEQCSKVIADFEINGTPYRGKWRKNESMSLFLKDLIEAAEEVATNNSLEVEILKEELEARDKEITRLERELEEARA